MQIIREGGKLDLEINETSLKLMRLERKARKAEARQRLRKNIRKDIIGNQLEGTAEVDRA